MNEFEAGLRAQDVHAGLRNLDQSSGILVPLADTQRIGMAAGIAALIRGRDVIDDVQSLQVIAAEQLDITPFAFTAVVDTLEQVGFISAVKRTGVRVESFSENVPFYADLYEQLGTHWRASKPTEFEQQVIALVDGLAHAPIPYDEAADRLGLDTSEFADVLELSEQTDLIKTVELGRDKILFSPFFGFENPDLIAQIVQDHGSAEIADAFATLRDQQGLPLSMASEVIEDAVARGIIMAPSVELPSGEFEAFATLPYTIDRQVLKGEKPIMEKTLAIIACLRTGQHFGGYSSLPARSLVMAIDKLLRQGYIDPHSSSERQYRLLSRAGVIELGPDNVSWGRWRTPTLIDTPDNRAALMMAKDLLSYGESVASRVGGTEAAGTLLNSDDPYGTPMRTVQRYKKKKHLTDRQWQSAVDKMLGHR